MQFRTYLLLPLLAGGAAFASPSTPETSGLSVRLDDAASILELFVESASQASQEVATASDEEILLVDRRDRQCRREQRRSSRYHQNSYPRSQFYYYGGRDRDDWDDDDWDDDDWDDDDDDRRHYYYRSAPAPYRYYTQPRYHYYRH